MKNYLFCINAWSQMSRQSRVAVLAQVKHPILLAACSFPYLPQWVRADLQRVLLLKAALK